MLFKKKKKICSSSSAPVHEQLLNPGPLLKMTWYICILLPIRLQVQTTVLQKCSSDRLTASLRNGQASNHEHLKCKGMANLPQSADSALLSLSEGLYIPPNHVILHLNNWSFGLCVKDIYHHLSVKSLNHNNQQSKNQTYSVYYQSLILFFFLVFFLHRQSYLPCLVCCPRQVKVTCLVTSSGKKRPLHMRVLTSERSHTATSTSSREKPCSRFWSFTQLLPTPSPATSSSPATCASG